jgi:hypothetical protein
VASDPVSSVRRPFLAERYIFVTMDLLSSKPSLEEAEKAQTYENRRALLVAVPGSSPTRVSARVAAPGWD